MAYYSRKPSVVEAFRIASDNVDSLVAWIRRTGGMAEAARGSSGDRQCWIINVLSPIGFAMAAEGDWIVRDQSGNFYPFLDDDFLAAHDQL